MHHKINAENTNFNTEKCSPGCPVYFHTMTTIPESRVTTIVGVLSDVNLHFIVQAYPLARMKFRTIQDT